MKAILVEKQSAGGSVNQCVKLDENSGQFQWVNTEDTSQVKIQRGIKYHLHSIFLPEGYPDSVSDDYLSYQVWDTIQAFASSLTGSLATKAVLEGVGVGDSTSTPLAATLSWLIKDGTGMVGRILFAWLKGTELDADSKKWRLFADILNDAAMCLELCAPFIAALLGGSKTAVTGLLCAAGVAKSIVGVAGGATRAALTQHQARRDNLADVSAKDGSQETLVNLAALITSLWLLPFVGDSQKLTWLAFIFFTVLHLFANYNAVKSVQMETFNRTRFLLLLKQYASNKKMLSIKEANQLEPVVLGFIPKDETLCGYKIKLGDSVKGLNLPGIEDTLRNYHSKKYAFLVDQNASTIHIIIKEDCSSQEMLESYFIAVLSAMTVLGKISWLDRVNQGNLDIVLLETTDECKWKEFNRQLMDIGWNTDHCLLSPGEWRASW